MPRALVGVFHCGRCGAPQPDVSGCERCGAARSLPNVGDAALPTPGSLTGVVRAGRLRPVLAVVVDVAPVLALLGLAVAISTGTVPHLVAAWVPAALAVVAVVVGVGCLARSGRALGGLLLGLRTVNDLSALPPGGRGLLRRHVGVVLGRTLLTADLRAGRDPGALRLTPVRLGRADDPSLALATGPGEPVRPGAAGTRAAVGILLETGERYEIHDALLIGRNPVDAAGRGRAVLAWPDLSRRLAKTHLLLEWSGTVLWVTDLGSSTGTSLASVGGDQVPLTPAVRAAAQVGSVIEAAGRRIKVVSSG